MNTATQIALYFKIQTALDHLQNYSQEHLGTYNKMEDVFEARLILSTALSDIAENMDLHAHRVLDGVLDMELQTKTQEAV